MARPTRKKSAEVEWVGGIATLPTYVTGEGPPFRPEVLLWMSVNSGAVLGSDVAPPGKLLGLAGDHLLLTTKKPIYGRPHVPDRVRVASPELAAALRAGLTGIEVVCAPTPEIDFVMQGMAQHVHDVADTEQSYLAQDVGPDAIAALFRAAAALYREVPWETVPDGQSLLSFSIEKLDVKDIAVSVIGQEGKSFGVLIFKSHVEFEAFIAAVQESPEGEEPMVPPHLSLNFDSGADLDRSLRKEVAEHQWELASKDAYPWLVAMDQEMVGRPPTAAEVALAEAVALALPKVLKSKDLLLKAWKGGKPFERTVIASAHMGELKVKIRVPCDADTTFEEPAGSPLAALRALDQGGASISDKARKPHEDELLRRFMASPEAKDLTEARWCRFVMDQAASMFSATIATLSSTEFREIVYGIIPRSVNVDPSKAQPLIAELRAFYMFLRREYGLPQARVILLSLTSSAVRPLEAALSDSSLFGLGKRLLANARKAGFNVDSPEGTAQFMSSIEGKPLPDHLFPSLPQDPAIRPRKKAARKASKKKR